MRFPVSFGGELGRRGFALLAIPAFLAQHLFAYALTPALHGHIPATLWFWLNPLRALAPKVIVTAPAQLLSAALGAALLVDWLLAAWACRRSRQAGGHDWAAALIVVPLLQPFCILWLSLAPASPRAAERPRSLSGERTREALQGLFAGVAIAVGAVVLSALIFRIYGYALFLGTPLTIGLTTGYIVNRRIDIGNWSTLSAVMGALFLGGLALLGIALEGVVCLMLAAPLGACLGAAGGLLGRGLALANRPSRGTTLMSVAILPALIAGEAVLPPRAGFESVESVEVAASPGAVWDSVVHMGPIPGAPAAPFRWGLAYPMRGEIIGSGVGAIRRGVFSTGVAYERVTEWTPGKRLSFIVLSDPPTMRELSPYGRVDAPHVQGYFRTLDARFTITPLRPGRTRLTLATKHELNLEPALYWMPIAEWATHANKARVLAHFRDQAQAASRSRP